jgi:type III secretion protein R
METLPNPTLLIIGFTLLGLAPFLAVLVSSFVKLVVVMHIMRSALGLQQAPPNLAINGLAIILSIYIMAPVGMHVYNTFQEKGIEITDIQNPNYTEVLTDSIQPLKDFLIKHSDKEERQFFSQTTHKIWPENFAKSIDETHIIVLVPAFLVTELTEAFEIGFMLYLPFIIIDLIISNILISMGMIMVSPILISLPFKILLFVLVDGWSRLTHGLIMSYQ